MSTYLNTRVSLYAGRLWRGAALVTLARLGEAENALWCLLVRAALEEDARNTLFQIKVQRKRQTV